jgi:hypothetical protein
MRDQESEVIFGRELLPRTPRPDDEFLHSVLNQVCRTGVGALPTTLLVRQKMLERRELLERVLPKWLLESPDFQIIGVDPESERFSQSIHWRTGTNLVRLDRRQAWSQALKKPKERKTVDVTTLGKHLGVVGSGSLHSLNHLRGQVATLSAEDLWMGNDRTMLRTWEQLEATFEQREQEQAEALDALLSGRSAV